MADNIQDLKKQIQQLKKEIQNLGGESFKDMNAAIKAFGGGINGARKLISEMEKDVEDLRDSFGTISATLKNIVQDLKGAPNPVKETTRAFDKLESLTRKISDHRKNEEILTVKQLVNIKKQTAEEVKRLKENQKLLDKNSDAYREVTDALNEQTGLLKDINKQVEAELKNLPKDILAALNNGITSNNHYSGPLFDNINSAFSSICYHRNYYNTYPPTMLSSSGVDIIDCRKNNSNFTEFSKVIISELDRYASETFDFAWDTFDSLGESAPVLSMWEDFVNQKL